MTFFLSQQQQDEIRRLLTDNNNNNYNNDGGVELDDTTIDYLIGYFNDLDVDDDDDNDQEVILSTLQQFISNNEDICQQILSIILRKKTKKKQQQRNDDNGSSEKVGDNETTKTTTRTTTTTTTSPSVQPNTTTATTTTMTVDDENESTTTTPSSTNLYAVDVVATTTTTTTTAAAAAASTPHSPKSKREARKERQRQKRLQKQSKNKKQQRQQQTHGIVVSSDDDDDDGSSHTSSSSKSAHNHNHHTTSTTTTSTTTAAMNELLELNDHSSAWKETIAEGSLWGGRGRGGRGIRYYGENIHNLYLPSVSLQFHSKTLLEDTSMTIDSNKRYGILGRNGCGKSTLFKALQQHLIPGIPHSYRILLVDQHVYDKNNDDDDITPLQDVINADVDRTNNLKEQEQVENELEQGMNVQENAIKLEQLLIEYDTMDGDTAEQRATDILKGLGFTKRMITQQSTSTLSGGWKMRLNLAKALFVIHTIDLLLLDEVTNHLDLHGIVWLQQYLTTSESCKNMTMMIISHDRDFLSTVTTDIIIMHHQRLDYFPGNYQEYQRNQQERMSMQSNKLQAAEKQRQKAMEFIQKQQSQAHKKNADPNKLKQAKMMKDKKLDRIGMYREDGKKFHNFSLAKMDMKSARMGQHVIVEHDDAIKPIKLTQPIWPSSTSTKSSPIITFENVSFQYNNNNNNRKDIKNDNTTPSTDNDLLRNITLNVTRGSKIAIVGPNGCGKSTLLKLIMDELPGDNKGKLTSGRIWRQTNIRYGYVSQYSVEEMEQYGNLTVVEYATQFLKDGRASTSAMNKASTKGYGTSNIRQYLGAYGLGGEHAHRHISSLSGGERMRLCFATVMVDEPHVLVLDEATNHMDLETLDTLADALHTFDGSVIMVSHNASFLSVFANTLWICNLNGHVEALYSDIAGDGDVDATTSNTNTTFDELFGQYKSQIMSKDAVNKRSTTRRVQADLAKRAGKQSTGKSSQTGLM